MERKKEGEVGAQGVLSLQPASSISVAYHPLFGPHDDLILLEIDDKLVPDILNSKVTLRGQPDEDAVFCTKSKTYAIKFVGNSNSVFLIPPSDKSEVDEISVDCNEKDQKQKVASVIKVSTGNLELVEAAPRIDKLKTVLLENPFCFDESMEVESCDEIERPNPRLYKWDDLVNMIQASDDELRTGLQNLSAVEVDGYWRIVDEKYMDSILRMLLHNSVLNDWCLDALNEDEVVNVLESDGYPEKLARHCLHVYGSKVSEGVISGVWILNKRRVCVHFAREILKGGKMKMESFIVEWMQKIPDGLDAHFDMLEGEVLTEKVGVETWVHSFSLHSLPSTPAERFSILFRERAKWHWKDLQPYTRDLSVPGLSAEGLLLKYARRAQPTPDAEAVFSAR